MLYVKELCNFKINPPDKERDLGNMRPPERYRKNCNIKFKIPLW